MSKVKIDSKSLSWNALLSHIDELNVSIQREKDSYIKNLKLEEEPNEEETESYHKEWERSKSGKKYVEAKDNSTNELDKRQSKNKSVEIANIKVSLDDMSSTYNPSRQSDASGALDKIIEDLSNHEDEYADLVEELNELKADPKTSEKDISDKSDEILQLKNDIVILESSKSSTESSLKQYTALLDDHTAIVTAIGESDESTLETINEYIDAYTTAKNDVSDFDGDASNCRSISYGAKSSDKEILNAIKSKALEGHTKMVFEGDLWSWNDITLRLLIEKGFILSIEPTNIKHDKLGKVIGSHSVVRGILEFENKNTDLTVSWGIEQEKVYVPSYGQIKADINRLDTNIQQLSGIGDSNAKIK